VTGHRFGVTIIPSASGRSDPVAEAGRAEELGFDLVAVWDHPRGEHPSFETWTFMTWLAASTSRIRIASNVLAMPLRLPALVAKMAESLDRLSGGRLILGLGAGGDDAELAGFGAPTLPPEGKVDALEEAIEIIRGVWTEPTFTYDGAYYRNHDTLLEPKPARAIPIWLGAYGPRMLELTGRHADGWIPSMGLLPATRARAAMDRVRLAAERSGRDPDALDYAYNVQVQVGGSPPEDLGRRVAGEPAQVVEQLSGLLDLGFTVLNLMLGGRRDEQMELVGTSVLPELRGTG
jgi:alkanesulfonate monooxygenase SsuD/methylene tetrahydromethanopterin reductase-like flavin-dependent oxidoreductase (luciferase family)